MKTIPGKITIGGQVLKIEHTPTIEGGLLGRCYVGAGLIQIANTIRDGMAQSDSSKLNTFYHEVVHAILDSMGEFELSGNEKFVSSFSALLTDAMISAEVQND